MRSKPWGCAKVRILLDGDKLLPPRAEVRAVKHHAALAWTELPAFMKTLEKAEALSAKALRLPS
jgi:hypothetical protein